MSIKKRLLFLVSILLLISTGLTIFGVSYLTIVQTTAQNNNRLDNALNAFERVFTKEIAQVDTKFNAFTRNEDKARISYRVIKTDVDSGNISVEGFIKNLLYLAEDMGAESFALYFKKGKAYQQSIKFIYDRKLGGIIKVKPGGDEPDWFGIKDGYGIVQFQNTKYVLITLNEFGFLERKAIDHLNTYYAEKCHNETSYSFKVKDGKIVLIADLIYNSPIALSNSKSDSILGKFIIDRPLSLNLSQIDQDLGIYSNVYDHKGKVIGGQIQMPDLDSSLIGTKNRLFLSMIDRRENKYDSILTPLEYKGSIIAYLAANISQKEVKQRVANTIGLLLIIALVILAFLMIITSKIVMHLVRPILELIQSASEIASGNLNTHIDTSRTDELGNLAHSFANMRDSIREKLNDLKNEITTRKQIETALKDSEKQYRAVVEDSPNLICRFIPGMEIIFVNEEYCKYFDVSYENLIGQNFLTLIPAKDRQLVEANILAINIDSPIQTHEHEVMKKNGEIRWQQWINRALFDEKDEIIAYQSIGIDITARKLAEDALAQETGRLMVTLRSIGDGVITTDIKGRVVLINKIAEVLTGWDQNEAVGKHVSHVFNIINSQTKQICESPIDKVLETGNIVGTADDSLLVARDGTERSIADNAAPIFDTNSEIIGVILVFRDVTEKHRIEKLLQQSQKMEAIGTLAGGIAHDFNNMLGVITGNISYALSNLNKKDDLYEVLSDVQESSKQAQSLTHQLLTFSKGGAPIKKVVDINKLLNESVIFAIRGAKSKCNFELSNDLWATEIDEGQINQVVNNLVINANQAMPNGGVITIRTENTEIETESGLPLSAGRYIKIVVEDQGVGISKNHLTNIFDPYFTTKQKGSGLGLATTFSIINRHDGTITVYSEIEKGTVFNVYLPASSKNVKETVDKEELHHTCQGKILIMDDQESILKMTGRILNRMGYTTKFSTDGTHAIKLYRDEYQSGNPFDLVILDITVPGGMGGAKTIPELLKINPNVKAVVSSGYSNDPIMASYKDYGFCGVVPKPYTKAQLSKVLNKIFDKND